MVNGRSHLAQLLLNSKLGGAIRCPRVVNLKTGDSFMRRMLCGAAVVALLAAAPALEADAAPLFQIDGGTPYTLPTTPVPNNFRVELNAMILGSDEDKFNVGGNLLFTGAPGEYSFRYDFLGLEATFNNFFYADDDQPSLTKLFENDDLPSNLEFDPLGFASSTVLSTIGGDKFVPFAFGTAGFSDIVNGNNQPLGALRSFAIGIISSTQALLLFDDSGQGQDDNHDDMVIRITAIVDENPPEVPEPATLLVIGAGLLGMGVYGRRMARAKAGSSGATA